MCSVIYFFEIFNSVITIFGIFNIDETKGLINIVITYFSPSDMHVTMYCYFSIFKTSLNTNYILLSGFWWEEFLTGRSSFLLK